MDVIMYVNNKAYPLCKLGFCIKERIEFPIAKKKIRKIDVIGREGSLTIEEGYEDMEIEFNLNGIFSNLEEAEYKTKKIIHILNGLEEVEFSDRRNRYIRVKHVEYSNVVNTIKEHREFSVKITCEPFYYKHRKEEWIELDNSVRQHEIINTGELTSFKIKVVPSNKSNGTKVGFDLSLNNKFVLRELIDYIPKKIENNNYYLLYDFINGINEVSKEDGLTYTLIKAEQYQQISKIKENDKITITRITDATKEEGTIFFYLDEKFLY